MKPLETQLEEAPRWTYMHEKVGYKDTVVDKFVMLRTASLHSLYSSSQVHVQVVVKHHISNL
jgi:hypothetical protein